MRTRGGEISWRRWGLAWAGRTGEALTGQMGRRESSGQRAKNFENNREELGLAAQEHVSGNWSRLRPEYLPRRVASPLPLPPPACVREGSPGAGSRTREGGG